MHREAKELMAFLQALEKAPRDVALRMVFADWLEEHDAPELAALHRGFDLKRYDAEQYLRRFADRYASGDYEGMLQGLLDGDYCFSDDNGPYNARHDSELWESVEIVTRTDIGEEHRSEASFRCAC